MPGAPPLSAELNREIGVLFLPSDISKVSQLLMA